MAIAGVYLIDIAIVNPYLRKVMCQTVSRRLRLLAQSNHDAFVWAMLVHPHLCDVSLVSFAYTY